MLLLPSRAMVDQDWTPSKVTQECLQNLMSQVFMTGAELPTCHEPKEPASPTSVKGYCNTLCYENLN
jgi:hypothetical protein